MAKPKENPSRDEEVEAGIKRDNNDDTEKHQKKKKKKKKEKQTTVKIETIAENPNQICPIIGYFPSGYNPLTDSSSSGSTSTKLYKNVRRNKRFQVVVSPANAAVDFVGTNYSGEAEAPSQLSKLCTYSLGVLDKETQTLKIMPIEANKIIRLEPRVRGSEVLENEDPDTVKQELTAEERKDRLTAKYSTKKSIQQVKKLRSLQQQDDTGTQEEFDKNMAGEIKTEAIQEAGSADNARNVPPYDLGATSPQLAYPLNNIIFKGEWANLLDVLELVKSGADMTPDLYPSFVCNRSYKLDQIQDKEEKKKLAGIFSYITHLVKFKDRHSMDGVSSAKYHKIPSILSHKFSSMFSVLDSKRLPAEKINLLISYVLVLTLFADDFRTDPSDIARDLRMNAVDLRQHYEYLGCKFVREKYVLLATLPVPLKFPEIRRKRRR